MIPVVLIGVLKDALRWVVKNWQAVALLIVVGAIVLLYEDWRHRGELLTAQRAAWEGCEVVAGQWKATAEEQAAEIRKLAKQTVEYQVLLDAALKEAGKIRTEYVEVPGKVTVAVQEAPDCESAVLRVGAVLSDLAEDGGAP